MKDILPSKLCHEQAHGFQIRLHVHETLDLFQFKLEEENFDLCLVSQLLAPVLSLLLPKYQFDAANKPGLPVCRDPDALLEKYTDPLVYTGSIRVRTGVEVLHICNYLQQNLRKVVTPFFVLHGADDTVTDPEGSQKLYEEAASPDKFIKLYDGLLHDLLFEPEKKAVVEDIINWLVSKLYGQILDLQRRKMKPTQMQAFKRKKRDTTYTQLLLKKRLVSTTSFLFHFLIIGKTELILQLCEGQWFGLQNYT